MIWECSSSYTNKSPAAWSKGTAAWDPDAGMLAIWLKVKPVFLRLARELLKNRA
jgi:hypothetical protein